MLVSANVFHYNFYGKNCTCKYMCLSLLKDARGIKTQQASST